MKGYIFVEIKNFKMKISMIVFGIIFLVFGGLVYYVPMQEVSAGTTIDGDITNASAKLIIPVEWSYASLALGGFLLVFGLIIPGQKEVVQGLRGPRGASGRRSRNSGRRSRNYRRTKRTTRSANLPKGTSVTTTTRINKK